MISFLAAQYGTVSDVELVWTIIATVGAGFSIYNLRDALKDRAALKRLHNRNGRWLLANFAIRAEAARLAIQLIFLTIGILAMLIVDAPDQLHQPPLIVALGIVFRWGLIVSALLLTLKSYWGYSLRRTLLSPQVMADPNSESIEQVIQDSPPE
jgi:hypothetical protein